MPHAEQHYLFRHALMRDVAYELQLPSERAVLHGLALRAFEGCLDESALQPHALELADHAQLARGESTDAELVETECRYLDLGYRLALSRDHRPAAIAALRRLGALLPERSDARREALYELAIHVSAHDPAGGLRILDECEAIGEDDLSRGQVLRGRAMAHFSLKQREPGKACLREALALHEKAGDPVQLALTRNAYARMLLDDERFDDMESMLRDVLPVTVGLENPRYHGGALTTLGIASLRRDRHREAKEWFEKALAAHERSGPSRYLLASLQGLGRTLARLERWEEARAVLQRCVDTCSRCGEFAAECTTLVTLGKVLRKLGRREEAREAYTRAVRLGRETNLPEWTRKAEDALAQPAG